ncbi:MAG TPA: heme o synthase [Terracidiphilus sp.]|nr:heme o synthase [Terracidiphilus sp.]
METEATVAKIALLARVEPRERPHGRFLADYWALTKPDVNLLIAIAVFASFYLARPTTLESFPYALLINTLLGSLLIAGGTGALNQVIERRFDSQMRRTSRRPLATGSISPNRALWFGVIVSIAGAAYLALAVNLLSSLIAGLTLVSYLAVYTPLKRKTPMCTLLGALPGAAPPLIGWAAASGNLSLEAWLLYSMLFLWQFPHFMAIAWMYREDYDRAGYQVLPRREIRQRFVALQSVIPALLLVPISLIPALLGDEGRIYFVGAPLLGLAFLYCAARLAFNRSNVIARQLLLASIIYLPSVFLLMLLDRN